MDLVRGYGAFTTSSVACFSLNCYASFIVCYNDLIFFFFFFFCFFFFFFQAEDGIRDVAVTGVQTCALPI